MINKLKMLIIIQNAYEFNLNIILELKPPSNLYMKYEKESCINIIHHECSNISN